MWLVRHTPSSIWTPRFLSDYSKRDSARQSYAAVSYTHLDVYKRQDLLEEIAALKAMVIAADARDLRKDERIERLEKLVAAFKHAAFGRRSEKSNPDQFELALEDLETAIAAIHAEEDAEDRATKRPVKQRATNRGALPKHLPRIEEVIEPASLTCACGGSLHCIGEDVTERLDIMPA